jgi:threonine-phosphate decarboxylase
MIRGHGGNIYEAARIAGCRPEELVDMSSNVNPLGPPPGLDDHLRDRIAAAHALPEADAAGCCARFARRHGIDPECVAAANGTTQFIYSLPRALAARRALIPAPAYADYGDACRRAGVDIEWLPLSPEEGFSLDPETLDRRLARVDLAFICNPNNPTGGLLPASTLVRLCRAHPTVRFVVDESYLPFLFEGEENSMAGRGLANVLVLNSLSKIYRVPGLRIGFLIGPPDLLAQVRRSLLPWSVGSLAQAAVDFLMTPTDSIDAFLEKSRRHVEREVKHFSKQIDRLSGFGLFPSCTIFSLIRLPDEVSASQVLSRLLAHRILVRNCANFRGLSERYIRVSLKRRGENDLLADRLPSAAVPAGKSGAGAVRRTGPT